jgi:hypothetical protein
VASGAPVAAFFTLPSPCYPLVAYPFVLSLSKDRPIESSTMKYPNARLVQRLYEAPARAETDAAGDDRGDSMGLRATLLGLAAYTGLLGLLFLLSHELAASVLEIQISDPVSFHQWGAALLMLALLAVFLATDPRRYRRLLLVPLLGLALDCLVLAYDLISGVSGPRQLVPPLAINVLFLLLLALFYPRERREMGGRRVDAGASLRSAEEVGS